MGLWNKVVDLMSSCTRYDEAAGAVCALAGSHEGTATAAVLVHCSASCAKYEQQTGPLTTSYALQDH